MGLRWMHVMVSVVMLGTLSGCRSATRVIQEPRVDLELAGGNRGFLVGAPPEGSAQKTTRQMVEAEVEVPSRYKPVSGQPLNLGAGSVSSILETPTEPEASERTEPATIAMGQPYVVKPGDNLSKISKAVYGDGRYWRRIYDANRNVLSSPNKLRPGMTLQIPAADGTEGMAQERTPFTK